MTHCCHGRPHVHAKAYCYDTSNPDYFNVYGAYMQSSDAWFHLMKVLYEFGITVEY